MVLLSFWSITVNSQSLTITDDSCTCIPNKDLRKGAYWIEQGKMTEQILQETNKIIDSLNARIATKEKIIEEYETWDTTYQGIIETYRREVDNLVKQREVAVEAAKKLDKLLRRQKRKTIIAIAGTAIVVGGIFILAK